MRRLICAINISRTPSNAVLEDLHLPANAQMHQTAIVEIVRKIAPIMADVVRQGVYHTAYPLETMEFLLAGNQFYLDVATFHWNMEELAVRAAALVRVIELSLGAAEGSFAFLLETLDAGKGRDESAG
jgi:hypothetical protein